MPFTEIEGHAPLFQLLARAVARESLPPSLIFAGPDGVGKKMAAVALAQLLNCLAPAPGDACGACASCRRIARRVHADLLVIEPGDTGSIKVEQVRDAVERTAYRPFEGRRRMVIIDTADALVIPAQDALLKTLEEPPPASVFVLVTSRPDVLLPTVRSRCQRLRFGRLAPAAVAAVLMARHEYSEADAYAAASVSDGSVGAALEGGTEGRVDARDAAALTPHALRVAADETLTCFHLVEGTSEHVPATAEAIQQARGRTAGPALFVATAGGDKTGKGAQ